MRFRRSLQARSAFGTRRNAPIGNSCGVVEALERRALLSASPVQLDADFGGDDAGGFVKIDGLGRGDVGRTAVLQPDGKILVVGDATSHDGSRNHRGLVARLNPDGTLDGGFDGDGVLIVELLDTVSSIALLPDGKILLGGDYWNGFDRAADAYVVRLHRDGTVDESFGQHGRSEQGPDLSSWGEAFTRLAVGPDGKIVGVSLANSVAGHDQGDFGVMRFNPDGTLDKSFGGDGAVTTNFGHVDGHGWDAPSAVVVLPGGKVLVGGATGDYAQTGGTARDGGFALARYNADGSPDASFGEAGVSVTRFVNPDPSGHITWGGGWIHDLHMLPDGRFLAAGTSSIGNFTMARYKADGSVDTSWGDDGFATAKTRQPYGGSRIAALEGGKFAVASTAMDSTVSVTVVDADGTVIGTAAADAGGGASRFLSSDPVKTYAGVAFETDGDLVAVGTWAPRPQPFPPAGDIHEYLEASQRWLDTLDVLVSRFSVDLGAVKQPEPEPEPSPRPIPPTRPPTFPEVPIHPPAPRPVPPVNPGSPPTPAPGPGGDGEALIRRVSARRRVRGGKFYQFTVTFGPAPAPAPRPGSPRQLVRLTVAPTFDRQVTVSGPNGFSAVAERVKLRTLRRGARTVATYRFAAPGGAFDAGDNGTYTLRLGDAPVVGFSVQCPATARPS